MLSFFNGDFSFCVPTFDHQIDVLKWSIFISIKVEFSLDIGDNSGVFE